MEIVTITEARRRLDGALPSYKAKIEYVTPDQALGRITARDITAAHAYPPYRKSPFDGYAIHSHEGTTYEVVATIGAGIVYEGPVAAGQAVRLMTGCAVSGDCDTVIPQEYVDRRGTRIEVTETIKPGSNIIPVGEECKPGAIIIPAGTKLTAGALSVAVGLGNDRLPVYAKPEVLFLTSGRELVMPGEVRHDGQIYNSNAYLFRSLLEQYGAAVTFYHVSDGPDDLADEIAAVLSIGTLSQCLILDVFARSGLEILSRFVVEDAAHHSVEQHGYATTFTRLAHEFTQVIVEGRSRVCVAVGLGLLVVVAKLDEHVVARLDAVEHGLPKSAVDE